MAKQTDLEKELQDVVHRLNMLIKAKCVGGFYIVPWGLPTCKVQDQTHSVWIVHGDPVELNMIKVSNDEEKN